jgi:NAD(P)-dependent dehydrogenase (short-subunit alcohol dehydrogenase family)
MGMKDFKGKVAVVTGAASGIGKALVERCLAEGMQVVMADIEEEALTSSAAQFRSTGDNHILPVICDVSKREQVEYLAKRAVETFGDVHLLFNNAGVIAVGSGSVWHSSYEDWEWVIGVNLWGVIHGVKTFMPLMQSQDGESHIINTASVAGLLPGYGSASYAVTKHGVVALTENLYAYLGANRRQIAVSVLCPGYINTNISNSGRNRPEELKNDEEIDAEEKQRRGGQAMLAAGMQPTELADIVFNGIRERRLYIQTHEDFNQDITVRAENITSGSNPVLGRTKSEREEVMSRKVECTEQQLKSYVGDYQLASGGRLTYFVKEGGLWFVNSNTGGEYEVVPVATHCFELVVAKESYEFVVEEDKASRVRVALPGAVLELDRIS